MIYVLREGTSDIFKVGRTAGTLDSVLKRLRTGNSSSLVPFDTVETDRDHDSACEAFFHRRLRAKRVVGGGGWEFFQVDPEEMCRIIQQFKTMFDELVAARDAIGALKDLHSTGFLLAPTSDDEDLLQRLLVIKEEQEHLNFERELIECKLKQRIGRSAGLRGIATWKSQLNRMYDEALFRREEPELYEEILERFHCVDTSAWKSDRPDEYRRVQTTYFRPEITRKFILQKTS